ncbi:PREDICTED: protein TRC8 homolog [Ficedula albicollis]|uniref:protein TRC8 homolog n=1 Tax=Ficedula albicollis TaxID=59894 RepID=UPI0003594676|nr:PREDICTED: protein TRC8 homolog [Ficedula albicollis]XP_016159578.1 PREDICTED: protein TRC8 homolog [Ficedula albicollis]
MSQLLPAGPSEMAAADGLCPICLGDLENATCAEVCQHRFCLVCICEWAKLTETCPLCKRPLGRLLRAAAADESRGELGAGWPARRRRRAARARGGAPQRRCPRSRRRADRQSSAATRGTVATDGVRRDAAAVRPSRGTSQQAPAASTSREGAAPSTREHLASPAATPDSRAAAAPAQSDLFHPQ